MRKVFSLEELRRSTWAYWDLSDKRHWQVFWPRLHHSKFEFEAESFGWACLDAWRTNVNLSRNDEDPLDQTGEDLWCHQSRLSQNSINTKYTHSPGHIYWEMWYYTSPHCQQMDDFRVSRSLYKLYRLRIWSFNRIGQLRRKLEGSKRLALWRVQSHTEMHLSKMWLSLVQLASFSFFLPEAKIYLLGYPWTLQLAWIRRNGGTSC